MALQQGRASALLPELVSPIHNGINKHAKAIGLLGRRYPKDQ